MNVQAITRLSPDVAADGLIDGVAELREGVLDFIGVDAGVTAAKEGVTPAGGLAAGGGPSELA